MKKVLMLIVASVMVLGVIGCGAKEDAATTADTGATTTGTTGTEGTTTGQ